MTPITHAVVRLLTYTPRDGRSTLGYHRYAAGHGTPDERVLYANQQTGYHDCRIAICLAQGVPLDDVDPSRGFHRPSGQLELGWAA